MKRAEGPTTMLTERAKGTVAGVLSAGLYGVLSYEIHINAGRLPATEVMFIRSLSAIVIFLPAAITDSKRLISPACKFLWLRSIAAVLSLLLFSWNLQHTSVALANALFSISPLIVGLVAWKMQLESAGWKTAGWAFLVAAGTFLFWTGTSARAGWLIWMVGIGSAAFSAVSALALKKAVKSWSTYSLTWALGFAGLPITLALRGPGWIAPRASTIGTFVAICLLSIAAQLFLVFSFNKLQSTAATALGSSSVLWSVLLEVTFGSYPGLTGVAGSLLYCIGMTRLILSDTRPFVPKIQLPD